jgi:hypothetical protein
MTAIAMQQAAAAAAAGQHFMLQPNMQLLPAMVSQMQQQSQNAAQEAVKEDSEGKSGAI